MGSYPLVVDDIKRGRLIAPFGFIESGHNYVLISQQPVLQARELLFLEWLKNQKI